MPIGKNDYDWFLSLNRDAHVRKYLWDDERITEETCSEIINLNTDLFEKERFGLWKVASKISGIPIGYCGLWYFFEEEQPQLIYVLSKDFTRQGLAIEMSTCIVNYAMDELQFSYLIASMDSIHHESINLAKKLGMRLVKEVEVEGRPTVFYELRGED